MSFGVQAAFSIPALDPALRLALGTKFPFSQQRSLRFALLFSQFIASIVKVVDHSGKIKMWLWRLYVCENPEIQASWQQETFG